MNYSVNNIDILTQYVNLSYIIRTKFIKLRFLLCKWKSQNLTVRCLRNRSLRCKLSSYCAWNSMNQLKLRWLAKKKGGFSTKINYSINLFAPEIIIVEDSRKAFLLHIFRRYGKISYIKTSSDHCFHILKLKLDMKILSIDKSPWGLTVYTDSMHQFRDKQLVACSLKCS